MTCIRTDGFVALGSIPWKFQEIGGMRNRAKGQVSLVNRVGTHTVVMWAPTRNVVSKLGNTGTSLLSPSLLLFSFLPCSKRDLRQLTRKPTIHHDGLWEDEKENQSRSKNEAPSRS